MYLKERHCEGANTGEATFQEHNFESFAKLGSNYRVPKKYKRGILLVFFPKYKCQIVTYPISLLFEGNYELFLQSMWTFPTTHLPQFTF